MARVWSCGFETGTLGHELAGAASGTPVIQSTTKRSGNYAMQFTAPTLSWRESKLGFNLSTGYFRICFYLTAMPATTTLNLFGVSNSGDNDIANIRMTGTSTAPAGRIQIYNSSTGTDVLLGTGTAILNLNAWNVIELKVVIGAGSGIMESKVNGTVDQTFTGLTNNARGNIDRMLFGPTIGAFATNIFYDDLAVDDAAYCGDSKIIARQPVTGGSPTYNSWTKQSGTDAGAMWDETPFSTATYCTSSTSGAAQTAVIADFSATQTGHGSETIGGADTINGCKAAIVAKSGTASSATSIRRRINSVDTDTSITLSTVDAYYETAVFTATPAAIDIAELGAAHGANTNLHTVEDVWLLVDFTASTGVTGTFATTEATDTASFAANAFITTGTLATTEATDTASFVGGGIFAGTLTTTEAADTASFAGGVDVAGTLETTEADDITSFAAALVFGAVYLDNTMVGPNIVLTNMNLTARQTTATIGNVRTNVHQSVGKYYYEFTVDQAGDKQVGICTVALPLNEKLGQSSLVSVGVDDTNGWVGAGGIVTAPALLAGHVYGMAVDVTVGKAWCKDLTVIGGLWNENISSDPVTGVGGALFFVSPTPPVITSGATASVPENTTAVMTVTATDPG